MGIAGVTLEAVSTPGWADGLTSEDAARAVGYATLELNGFPTWLVDLARAKPKVVLDVLSKEVEAELARPVDRPGFRVLEDLARGDGLICALMAPMLLGELEKRPAPATALLRPILDTIVRGLNPERRRLMQLAIRRFSGAVDPDAASFYIGAAFAVDGAAATDAVLIKLKGLNPADRQALLQRMLPHVFGSHFSDGVAKGENLPLPSLEQLVHLAFTNIRIDEDNVRPSGEVFSPDDRDDAQNARDAIFSRFVNTPGRATYDAILRLVRVKGFPIPQERLRELATRRAANDSELAAWKPGEAFEFEKSAETEPQTAADLQIVALRRLADMRYDLLHDDFQQGETLAGLPNEKAVQKWTADRLRLKQGRAYSVEREVHVADEKEPDVRLRAKASDASVPLEVKVAETWTLPELDAALTAQLCDKYLRAREGRYGILLLVHKKPKPRGWTHKGKRLTFENVVTRLRSMASKIAGASSDAPQPEIAVLDVSGIAKKKPAKTVAKKKLAMKVTKKKPDRVAKKKPAKKKAGRRAQANNVAAAASVQDASPQSLTGSRVESVTLLHPKLTC